MIKPLNSKVTKQEIVEAFNRLCSAHNDLCLAHDALFEQYQETVELLDLVSETVLPPVTEWDS